MWVVDSLGGEWREGCATCLRRTTPPPPIGATWMTPPLIVAFWCEGLIEPEPSESAR